MSATLFIDGEPASSDDLAYQAMVNYGAYTSFRVEQGGVRGLDLHLVRLEASAVGLFGQAVGEDRIRDLMRAALEGGGDAWLRISLFSPEIWPRTPSALVRPKVMMVVSPPPPPLAASMRLCIQPYAREEAHLKHTATFGLIRARRLAREAGFDDALFVDADGLISEGSTWNIGFIRGDQVTWPQAPMLSGVTQSLITKGLDGVGMTGVTSPVVIKDLDRFDGAFLCNSATPACPILAIGEHRFETAPDVIARLGAAWSAAVPQPI